jgi:hypothetical protein
MSRPGRENAALVGACHRARGDGRKFAAVLVALRQSTVYGKNQPGAGYHAMVLSRDAVPVTSWLCVYTSPSYLCADVGWCDWWAMPGALLLDTVLPQVGSWRGWTGLVLDRGSDHAVALPPLAPVITWPAAAGMDRASREASR